MNDLSERIVRTAVGPEADGKRIDVYLSERFDYLSRHKWQELIKGGKISLNGTKTRCSRRLQAGEEITFIAEGEEPEVDFSYNILYEDDYFFVIDKSGNLPCHPAGPYFKNTLWHHLSERHGKVYIVNRLDRETSGILLAAKTPEICSDMIEIMSREESRKVYIAAVYGRFDQDIDADGWLIPDLKSEVRKKRSFIMGEGVPGNLPDDAKVESSRTFLRPRETGDEYSLVEAELKTGRMHQIRATLCSLGFPLLGDKLYGPDDTIFLRFISDEMTEDDWEQLVFTRQALHAWRLEFTHPVTGEKMQFEAPWPESLNIS